MFPMNPPVCSDSLVGVIAAPESSTIVECMLVQSEEFGSAEQRREVIPIVLRDSIIPSMLSCGVGSFFRLSILPSR